MRSAEPAATKRLTRSLAPSEAPATRPAPHRRRARAGSLTRRERFAAYALIGFTAEVLYTGVADVAFARTSRLRFRTSPWMLPVYGLAQPLYEPLHDAMRGHVPPLLRAVAYGAGFMSVEYASGRLLQRTLGRAPWDYSAARHHLHGLVRADYFVLWAAAGIVLEPVHDRLARDLP